MHYNHSCEFTVILEQVSLTLTLTLTLILTLTLTLTLTRLHGTVRVIKK